MTIEEFWKSWLLIWLLAGPILIAIVAVTYSLYLSHHHLGAMKEALRNSRYIYLWGSSLGKRGLIWSLLEISKIAGMILMPRASLRMGELDPIDLENFPPYLKRRLKVVTGLIVVGVIWLAAISVLIEFE
ncbi:hypothetical protein AYK59_11830 [Pseudomonas synxantha]|uniref:Transmembrane protein n=2 Tax=Pseudomonas fluorescens group TaxID=136843 RepID=A0AAN0XAT4_9PSED|nr:MULTISPECIES: hypothetical protein [Pseudomonas]AMS20797.1 hypothetical protein AYK59_11830 [Pseudomonas synxantha]AZE65802.1 hypothetical protein C4K01_1591 [Pseudomonas synxantha]KPG71952.1 hypothetical protein AEQ48_23985 [Pseudomonas libanensis]KRP56748.1 hypothetical protein TU77_04415 [Pseudomonas synxantha]MBI6567841.1 hypothetical protein [Pseudomonas synxantha]